MTEQPAAVRLEFADVVDLQTRLVLLPLIEEEGVGAVVAAYTAAAPKEPTSSSDGECLNENDEPVTTAQDGDDDSKENVCHHDAAEEATRREIPEKSLTEDGEEQEDSSKKNLEQHGEATEATTAEEVTEENHTSETGDDAEDKDTKEHVDHDGVAEEPALEGKKPCEHDDDGTPEETASKEQPCEDDGGNKRVDVDAVGMILSGIATNHECEFEDCMDKDFTSILATIREAPLPIVLLFQSPAERTAEDDEEEEEEEEEESLTTGKEPAEEGPEACDDSSTTTSITPDPEDSEKSSSPPRNILGNTLSSWGSRVRATSAILAAEAKPFAASLVTAASEASERAKSSRLASSEPALSTAAEGDERCGLFLQSNTGNGKFIPLSAPVTSNASLSSGSTRSLSSSPKVTTCSVLLVRLSALQACPSDGYDFQWYRSFRQAGSVSELGSKDLTDDGSVSSGTLEWALLSGATHAAYQPSATDVGHYLRCVVRIEKGDADDDGAETVICTIPDVVAADMSLFNGATQALMRGAKFGNMLGRGKAEGRHFRVHVEIGRSAKDDASSTDVTSSLTIFQVSGNTAEALHEEPILGATAISDPSRPKDFDLVLPVDTTASLVSALSTDGRLELQAPNRITRESFLLTMGIANYTGKPADLSVQTVLYPGRPSVASVDVGESTPFKPPINEEVEFFTPPESLPQRRSTDDTESAASHRAEELEKEVHRLRAKMARKDKTISDLQMKVQKTQSTLSSRDAALEIKNKELRECRSALRAGERRIETYENTVRRLKGDHAVRVETLERRIASQSDKITELEKNVRSTQNEKAVLSAAVEARDSKLSRMAELQTAVDNLSEKVSKGDSVKLELNDMSRRYTEISQDLERVSNFEKECRNELQRTQGTMEDLQKRLTKEQEKSLASRLQLESLQAKSQKLQAERNNYKQRADSLSKEVNRLCRDGLTLRDIEKIVLDEEARQMEVSLLKSQKRKALEDLHHYRTAYEQALVAQEKAGLDGESMRALEQKAELERVIGEMTEYVNAKEQQLETLKQVNQALSEELHMLAQANMSKNDI